MNTRGLSMSGAFQLPKAGDRGSAVADRARREEAAAKKKKGVDQVVCYAECASSGTRYCPLTVPSPVTRL